MHEVHCARFLITCNQCRQSIPKTKKLEHDTEYHKKEKCPYCSLQIDKIELGLHKTICNARPKPCLYCGAIMDLASLINHEDNCGSRTEICDNCGNNVVIKDFPEHIMHCLVDDEPQDNGFASLKRKKNNQNHGKKRGKK